MKDVLWRVGLLALIPVACTLNVAQRAYVAVAGVTVRRAELWERMPQHFRRISGGACGPGLHIGPWVIRNEAYFQEYGPGAHRRHFDPVASGGWGDRS